MLEHMSEVNDNVTKFAGDGTIVLYVQTKYKLFLGMLLGCSLFLATEN